MKSLSRRQLLGRSLQLAGGAASLPLLGDAQQSEVGPSVVEPPTTMPVRTSHGRFVWVEGEPDPYHFYLYARRSFDLGTIPEAARLDITASDRYVLYVNGAYLGRGPSRSDPRRKSYDRYDVRAYLRPGRNVIAVRAYHYGTKGQPLGIRGNAYTIGERAGLWAQLELRDPGKNVRWIGTDDDWRLRPARAWNRNAPQINILIGSTEIYDASADPGDWMSAGFDDRDWPKAWVIPQSSMEWVLLKPRYTLMMVEKESFPARIVEIGEVIDQSEGGETDIPKLLNEEIHFPLEHAVVRNPEALLQNDGRKAEFGSVAMTEQGIRNPFVILDFGRQLFGFPRVRLNAEKGAIVDMTYGQQLQNKRIPPALPYGDRYIAGDGSAAWEVSEYKQFRYLQLTLRGQDSPVRIGSVSVNEYRYPAEQRGRFECSDGLLTKLWQACVDTTYMEMEDTIVADAWRERAAWITGDGSHGLHGVFMGYGDLPLTDFFLRSVPLSNRGDGMLQMVYPPDNPRNYNIPQFMLQWGTRVKEHYLFTGRRAILEELYPSVRDQIDWYRPFRDEMGLLRDLPYWNWMDWTPNDMRGANCTTNALYVNALDDAAWIADQLGEAKDAVRWRAIAAEARPAMRKLFWSDERGFYEDSHLRGRLTGVVSEMGNGCALLYGVAVPEQVARIAGHFASDNSAMVGVSPLYFGYVLDGLLGTGLGRIALSLIRARFAPMLNSIDHPTIWENWGPFSGSGPIENDEYLARRHFLRPAAARSLVHTGGVLAGFILTKRILGVMPTGAGFSQCVIQPNLVDLEWAKGVCPTPFGDLQVEWRRANGILTLQAALPKGVDAEVILNRDPGKVPVVTHNEVRLSARSGLRVEKNQIRLGIGAGAHTIQLSGFE